MLLRTVVAVSGLTSGLGRRFPHMAMSHEEDRQRLRRVLDSVELSAPPRVELTVPAEEAADPISSLVVLDSSFNPPTRAHLAMLRATMEQFGVRRSLLLLAKQNADKPVLGANLVQRLQMMERIAAAQPDPMVCGVTAHPLFIDKAVALKTLCADDTRVYMLVGYDTWTRIVDPQYYSASDSADARADAVHAALRTIFSRVDVVVASREPSSAANLDDELTFAQQEAAVLSLPHEVTGDRLHFLPNEPGVSSDSSSAIRAAVRAGEGGSARAMLPDCLHEYVESEGLYREEG